MKLLTKLNQKHGHLSPKILEYIKSSKDIVLPQKSVLNKFKKEYTQRSNQ